MDTDHASSMDTLVKRLSASKPTRISSLSNVTSLISFLKFLSFGPNVLSFLQVVSTYLQDVALDDRSQNILKRRLGSSYEFLYGEFMNFWKSLKFWVGGVIRTKLSI